MVEAARTQRGEEPTGARAPRKEAAADAATASGGRIRREECRNGIRIRMGDEEVGAAAGGLITTVPRPPTSRLQPCTLACRAWLARTT